MELTPTGSSTELHTSAPRIIFAPLFSAMIQTLKKRQDQHFFYFSQPNGALHFETSSFISAVFKNISLQQNDGHPIYNIIKDIELPPKNSKLRISTLLDKESEFKTSQLYQELDCCMAELITQLMKTAPDNYQPMTLDHFLGGQNFVIDKKFPDPNQYMYEIPHKLNAHPFVIQGNTKVSFLEYTSDLIPKEGVLRLFTAVEELDEPKWVEKIRSAIHTKMKQVYKDYQQTMTAENSQYITEVLDDECLHENNQILGLLSFIENQGLSRARSKNCFKIMELIAEHVEKTVVNDVDRQATLRYIRNISAFHQIFGEQIAPWNKTEDQTLESFVIDVSAVYGTAGIVDIGHLLRYVSSTDALPIWVHPKIELNDARVQNKEGLTLKREVSYAFRVNGEFVVEERSGTRSSKMIVNGKENLTTLTAYEARLHRINEALLLVDIVDENNCLVDESVLFSECENIRGRNQIFQLIMLYFVLSDQNTEEFKHLFSKLVSSFKDPKKIRPLLKKILIEKLNSRETHQKIARITQTINTALKSKMEFIFSNIDKNASLKTAIYLESSILNTSAFKPSLFEDQEESSLNIFNGDGNYYDYLTIVDTSRKNLEKMSEEEIQRMTDFSKKSLAQIDFKSRLKVKTLIPIKGFKSKLSEFKVQRDCEMSCLPVAITPYKRTKLGDKMHAYSESSLNHDDLLSMYKVMIHYTSNLFRLSALSGRQNPQCLDEKENGLIISSCCYAIATHLFMKHLIKYTHQHTNHKIYVPVLRVDSVDEIQNDKHIKYETQLQKNKKRAFNPEAKRAYATAYMLEKVLNNNQSTVKVQGLKYQPSHQENYNNFGERIYTPVNLSQDQSISYRLKTSIQALSGYTPIIVPFEGTVNKIACISYNSRPENSIDFNHQSVDKTSTSKVDYSYICYVYLLERINENQGKLSLKLVNFVPVAKDKLKTSKALHRILENFQSDGIKDVVLLSHHFAAPKIGKTEKNNLIHENEGALDQLDALFPSINFYPLQSDIVPALSLKERSKGTVYEVPHHRYQSAVINKKDFKQSLPIYCFATKKIVGKQQRIQNGICTYFYMLSSQESSIHNEKRLRVHHAMVDESDTTEMKTVRSILRGIHYFESEKSQTGNFFDPVLEPSHIGANTSIQKLGEIVVSNRMKKGEIVMSLPALIYRLEEFIVQQPEKQENPS